MNNCKRPVSASSFRNNLRNGRIQSLVVALLLILNGSGNARAEQVLRPQCNLRVEAFEAPRQSVVPVGTLIYKCPDERSRVRGKLAAEGYFKLVGEYGDWYEYEGRPGEMGYFRKMGVTIKAEGVASSAASSTTDAPGSQQASAEATQETAAPALPTQLPVAPIGVEFEKSDRPCVTMNSLGYPNLRADGADANLYVPEDFAITDEAKVSETLLYGAAGVRAVCGAGASVVKINIYPASVKSRVGKSSGFVWGDGGVGRADWVSGSMEYDQASGRYRIGMNSGFRNYEAERRERCAPLAAFFKRTGVQSVVDIKDLTANPFVYEGKRVAVLATFVEMVSRDEAIFGRESFIGPVDNFVATGVPTTRFGGAKKVVLVGKVNGKGKHTMPSGQSVLIAELAFVDAYDQAIDDKDIEPAFKDSQRKNLQGRP